MSLSAALPAAKSPCSLPRPACRWCSWRPLRRTEAHQTGAFAALVCHLLPPSGCCMRKCDEPAHSSWTPPTPQPVGRRRACRLPRRICRRGDPPGKARSWSASCARDWLRFTSLPLPPLARSAIADRRSRACLLRCHRPDRASRPIDMRTATDIDRVGGSKLYNFAFRKLYNFSSGTGRQIV